MRTTKTGLLLTIILLVLASPAAAKTHKHHQKPCKARHGHRCVKRRHPKHHAKPSVVVRPAPVVPQPAVTPTTRPTTPATPPVLPLPSIIEVGNVPGCLQGTLSDPGPYLREQGATVLRVGINEYHGLDGAALPCIQTAAAEGYRVNLSIQWDNHWTPAQVAAFVAQQLPVYAPYVWALSLGNEQELREGGITETGEQYAAQWQAAEPVARAIVPNAIMVTGEISVWGYSFLRAAWAAGLPGAQAIAAHPYVAAYSMDLPTLQAWVASTGLQLWYTEGLTGVNSWGADRPLTDMRGVTVAGIFMG